jgi:putative DNA primase/helicase
LYPFEERLGIAEGVESAIAAHEIFGLPVWSTMNTNGIKSFVPPGGTKEIGIFADNDSNYAGQAAAYELANKLCLKNYQVSVYIPPTDGFDWMDELLKTKGTSSYDYSEAK